MRYKFSSPEEMLAAIYGKTELYSPSEELYVFLYYDDGSICVVDDIDLERAKHLERDENDWLDELNITERYMSDNVLLSPYNEECDPKQDEYGYFDFFRKYYTVDDWMDPSDVLEF